VGVKLGFLLRRKKIIDFECNKWFYEVPGPRKFEVKKLHYIYISGTPPCAFKTENFRSI